MRFGENQLALYLMPFFIAVILFFNLRDVLRNNVVLFATMKVLPIISLKWFVKQHQHRIPDEIGVSRVKYVNVGLTFSGFGDVFLVWPKTFLFGIAAFALSHVMYINYFEIHPRNNILGFSLFLMNLLVFINISKTLNGLLLVAVLIYSNLLICMVWRSLDQAYSCKIRKVWGITGAVGGLLFCFSDLMIGVTMFIRPMQHSEVIIMSTYYAAQLAIALSTMQF